MFVFSAKITKKKMITAGLAAVAVIGLLIFVSAKFSGDDNAADQNTMSTKNLNTKLKSDTEMLAFLNELGWQVTAKPLEIMEVQIPEQFDAVYSKYNEIQKNQGLDLEKYKGKEVMRYIFTVTNHPSGEAEVYATLLLYNDKLIGGDICSKKSDGFMQSLYLP